MFRPLASLSPCLMLAIACVSFAGETSGERVTKTLAPYLDEGTYAVVRVDPGKIDLDALFATLRQFGAPAEQVQEKRVGAGMIKAMLAQAGAKEAFALFNWGSPLDQVLIVVPCEKDPAPVVKLLEGMPTFEVRTKGSVVLAGPKGTLAFIDGIQPVTPAHLTKAFASLGDSGGVQAVFVSPASLRRAFAELYPKLPPDLGGGSTATLAQGFVWAAAAVELGERLGIQATVQINDARTAEATAELLRKVIHHVAEKKGTKEHAPEFANSPEKFVPKVKDDRLVWNFKHEELLTVLVPLAQRSRQAAAQAQSANNLKQIALAMHNYADVNKGFPSAQSYDPKGKPLLSWRVHILHFVEAGPLYQEFRLNEPWDSEHNKKLIARMPEVYRTPEAKLEPGKTTYLVPVGKKTIFGGKKALPLQKITDGTSNTLLVVDASPDKAVYWTQPSDFDADAKDLLAILVGPGRSGFHAALADGSVRFLSKGIALEQLRAYLTATGGEVIQGD